MKGKGALEDVGALEGVGALEDVGAFDGDGIVEGVFHSASLPGRGSAMCTPEIGEFQTGPPCNATLQIKKGLVILFYNLKSCVAPRGNFKFAYLEIAHHRAQRLKKPGFCFTKMCS